MPHSSSSVKSRAYRSRPRSKLSTREELGVRSERSVSKHSRMYAKSAIHSCQLTVLALCPRRTDGCRA